MKYRMERYSKPLTRQLKATDGTRNDWAFAYKQADSDFEATSPEEAIAHFEQCTGHIWTAAFRLIALANPSLNIDRHIVATTNCLLE